MLQRYIGEVSVRPSTCVRGDFLKKKTRSMGSAGVLSIVFYVILRKLAIVSSGSCFMLLRKVAICCFKKVSDNDEICWKTRYILNPIYVYIRRILRTIINKSKRNADTYIKNFHVHDLQIYRLF